MNKSLSLIFAVFFTAIFSTVQGSTGLIAHIESADNPIVIFLPPGRIVSSKSVATTVNRYDYDLKSSSNVSKLI